MNTTKRKVGDDDDNSMNDTTNDAKLSSYSDEMKEFLAIEPPLSQILPGPICQTLGGRLHIIFCRVFEHPQMAGRLDPRFMDLEQCNIATKSDTPESIELVACLKECEVTEDWVPALGKAAEAAWLTKFERSSHQLLLDKVVSIADNKSVEQVDKPANIRSILLKDGNILPILQSSGMGKSRVVDELAKVVFTIPICLRETQEGGEFPPGDTHLVNAFLRPRDFIDDAYPKFLSITILTAIFEGISKELQRCGVVSPLEWYNRLNTISNTEGVSIRDQIYEVAFNKSVSFKRSSTALELWAARSKMQEALKTLINYLPDRTEMQGSKLKLIVYVDECQSLNSSKPSDDEKQTMLDSLMYAIQKCHNHGLFGIFISADPNILLSFRGSEIYYGIRHPDPFILSNYDFWRNNEPIITQSEMTLFDVCKMPFLARFGRPLWWTRITDPQTGEIDSDILRQLCTFAAVKLVGADNAEFGKEETANAEFAILSVRLSLKIDPMRTALERILVSRHMRIVYRVSSNVAYVSSFGAYMQSGYSSEPVLAEAAANLWNNSLACFKFFEPLALLMRVVEKGLLVEGNRSKLAARFILLRAQDIALSQLPDVHKIGYHRVDKTAPYSRPVSLWDFFKSLFNPEQLQELSSIKARNRNGGMTLEEACENKYVRFTHFADAGDSCALSTATGWKALARAIAWQCRERQTMVDIVIPVFMNVNNRFDLDKKAITFILIQVKNPRRSQNFSAETLGLFNDIETGRKIPYFVFIFDFGVSTNIISPHSVPLASPGIRTVGAHLQNTDTGMDGPQGDGHPCFWLEVKECSSNVFNSEIVQEGSKALSSILKMHSVFDETDDED